MIPDEKRVNFGKRECDEIERNYSMPLEWLDILLHEKTTDKATTLHLLKYEYTVEDVYDLRETYQVSDCIDYVRDKELKSREKTHNANR